MMKQTSAVDHTQVTQIHQFPSTLSLYLTNILQSLLKSIIRHANFTSSSAMAERQCELGDFKGVGQFEVKVQVKGFCA